MAPEEFQKLLPRLRPRLLALATRYLGNTDEAEDIVQDAMLKLWLLRQQVIGNVEAFALVMVRNMSLNRLRQLHRQETLSDFDRLELESTETTADTEEEVTRLLRIVETLPERQKIILRMHDLEGMDYDEIARLTGASVASLRQTVSRSRRLVRLRYLASVSAVVALTVGLVWGVGAFQDYRLESRYEGSYIVVAGQRNDNLRQIRPQLEQALAQAADIENAISERAFVRQAEAEVLQAIDDPAERKRIADLLKE